MWIRKIIYSRKIKRIFRNALFINVEAGLFKTYYPLAPIKYEFIRKYLRKLAKKRLFWPMIYVNGEKSKK